MFFYCFVTSIAFKQSTDNYKQTVTCTQITNSPGQSQNNWVDSMVPYKVLCIASQKRQRVKWTFEPLKEVLSTKYFTSRTCQGSSPPLLPTTPYLTCGLRFPLSTLVPKTWSPNHNYSDLLVCPRTHLLYQSVVLQPISRPSHNSSVDPVLDQRLAEGP